MKNISIYVTTFYLFFGTSLTAQVKIGNNPTSINANSLLELETSNKGLLLPRIALTFTSSAAPLSAHIAGMTVYNTATVNDVTPGYYYNDGVQWIKLASVATNNSWLLNGNAGTTAGANFLGTSDNSDLVFKRNNVQSGWLNSNNTGFGVNSLPISTTGVRNTATGFNSLSANTTGYYNTANGAGSLQSNTTGFQNTALGYLSLTNNITGSSNAAIGDYSMFSNITGSYNCTLGSLALYSNATGSDNLALGWHSMYLNTTGSNNIGIGETALQSNTTGAGNISLGISSLYANLTGANNVALGYQSLYNNKAGNNGTAIGYQSQYYANNTNTVWDNTNTSLGFASLQGSSTPANNTGLNNTAIGKNSMFVNSTGRDNTALGLSALQNNTTGNENIALGSTSLYSNTTGSNNTTLGYYSMFNSTTGSQNSAFGHYSLRNLTIGANNNTAIGYNTGGGITTGASNTILGANVTGLPAAISNNIILADGDGNQRINVIANGNVGINYATPSAKLHVIGDATGNAVNITPAANQYGMSMTTVTTAGQSFGATIAAGTNSSDASFYVRNASGTTPYLMVRGDGNVGIGTNSPTANLEVNGTFKLPSAGTPAANKVLTSDASGNATWQNTNAAALSFATTGGNLNVILAGSNVYSAGGFYDLPAITLPVGVYIFTIYNCAGQLTYPSGGVGTAIGFVPGTAALESLSTWSDLNTQPGSCGVIYTGVVRVTTAGTASLRLSSYNSNVLFKAGATAFSYQIIRIN